MPKAARLGDIGSAHGCFIPSPAIQGSPDVSINGKKAVRKGDAYLPHFCGNCPPHPRFLSKGSKTVSINGKAAGRVGDSIGCGGKAQTGSGNVFIGDKSCGGPMKECMSNAKQTASGTVDPSEMATEAATRMVEDKTCKTCGEDASKSGSAAMKPDPASKPKGRGKK